MIFVGLRFRKYEALGNDYLVIDPRDWPDGSEAEKSGNGIRIFARYLQDAGYVKGSNGTIVTAGGNAFFQYLDLGAHRIRVDMGTVTFWSGQIPVAGAHREVVDEVLMVGGRSLSISCLSIGNPHCVVKLSLKEKRRPADIKAD